MANELFRILIGVTSGEVQVSILKSAVSDVVNAARRLIAKGKSRTRAALREIKMKLHSTKRATSAAGYDAAVAEWDANVSKLEAYDADGEFRLSTPDRLDTYYLVFPTEAFECARSHIDSSSGCDPIEFEEFRTKMQTYIHRFVREGKSNQSLVAQVLKEELCKIGLLDQNDAEELMNERGFDSSLLFLASLKGAKGKSKGKGGKGPMKEKECAGIVVSPDILPANVLTHPTKTKGKVKEIRAKEAKVTKAKAE